MGRTELFDGNRTPLRTRACVVRHGQCALLVTKDTPRNPAISACPHASRWKLLDRTLGSLRHREASDTKMTHNPRCSVRAVCVALALVFAMTSPLFADPKMYWVDSGWDMVERATMEGLDREILVRDFMGDPEQMALDLASGKMYWTDSANGMIHRANLDGTNIEKLFDTNRSRGIALDLAAGKMYWVEWGTGSIRRADLNGDNPETLLTDLGGIWGIALDPVDEMIYYCGFACSGRCSGSIFRAEMSGANPELIVTSNEGLVRPVSVAVDPVGRKLYWVDFARHVVQRADLDGTNTEDLFATGGPRGIALDVPAGKMYWTGRDAVRRANLDGSDQQLLLGDSQVAAPVGIALDPVGGKMYWTDGTSDNISRADLDGQNPEELISDLIERPEALGVSLSTNRIYWTDWGTNEIMVADLDGANLRFFVPSGTAFPFALVVDDVNGHVYWSDHADDTILRADLDGKGATVIVSNALVHALAVDTVKNRLFWLDFDKVYRVDMSGLGRTVLVTFDEPLFTHGLFVDADAQVMYWTGGGSVFRALTDGSNAQELVTQVAPWAITMDVDAGKLYWTSVGSSATVRFFRADLDGSHVENLGIASVQLPRGIALDPRTLPGDCTRDGIVNQLDMQWIAGCLTGPDELQGVGCGCSDLDGNAHVDLKDYWLLQQTARRE